MAETPSWWRGLLRLGCLWVRPGARAVQVPPAAAAPFARDDRVRRRESKRKGQCRSFGCAQDDRCLLCRQSKSKRKGQCRSLGFLRMTDVCCAFAQDYRFVVGGLLQQQLQRLSSSDGHWIEVPNSDEKNLSSIQHLVISFSSKSEFALHLSMNGKVLTFPGSGFAPEGGAAGVNSRKGSECASGRLRRRGRPGRGGSC